MTDMPTAELGRDQGLSAICATACGVLAIGIPLGVAALWAVGGWQTLALVKLIPPDILGDLPYAIRPWQRLAGALISLVPALLLSYGLIRARRSLAAFKRGDFFAAEVVTGLRGYAAASFWAAFASIIAVPVIALTMTLANPPGHKELSADLSGSQGLGLLGAAILWVIASVMARARLAARENEQFV
jgi:hypothetical protein